jgi:hypothetical protein
MRVSSEGRLVREYPGAEVLDFVTRRVCKECNEGWLVSDIETPVMNRLTEMVRGQSVSLDRDSRIRIVAWLAKTAMIARYIHYPPDPVPQEWLTTMYRRHEAPASWHVWATAYHGIRPFIYEGRGVLVPPGVGRTGTLNGVLATFVMGHLAAKVLAVVDGQPRERDPGRLVSLAPSEERLIVWPPPQGLDDSSLQDFLDMYARH